MVHPSGGDVFSCAQNLGLPLCDRRRYPTEVHLQSDCALVNPYEPIATRCVDISIGEPVSRAPASLLAFLPGTTLGLHIGAAVEAGIPAAIQRTTGNPMASAKFFLGFATVALAVTFAYRVPRWYFVGRHRILWWSAFLSGSLIVGLGFSTVVVLGRLGFYNPVGPPTAAAIAILVAIVSVCVVLGVEAEACCARLRKANTGE